MAWPYCDKPEIGQCVEEAAWTYWSVHDLRQAAGFRDLTPRYLEAVEAKFGQAVADVVKVYADNKSKSGIMIREWAAQNIHRPGFKEADTPEFVNWTRLFLEREQAKASLVGESKAKSLIESPYYRYDWEEPVHVASDASLPNRLHVLDLSFLKSYEQFALLMHKLGIRWTKYRRSSSSQKLLSFSQVPRDKNEHIYSLERFPGESTLDENTYVAILGPAELKAIERERAKASLAESKEETFRDVVARWNHLWVSVDEIQPEFVKFLEELPRQVKFSQSYASLSGLELMVKPEDSLVCFFKPDRWHSYALATPEEFKRFSQLVAKHSIGEATSAAPASRPKAKAVLDSRVEVREGSDDAYYSSFHGETPTTLLFSAPVIISNGDLIGSKQLRDFLSGRRCVQSTSKDDLFSRFFAKLHPLRKPGDQLVAFFDFNTGTEWPVWTYAWLDPAEFKQLSKLRAKIALGESLQRGETPLKDLIVCPDFVEFSADLLPPGFQEFFSRLTRFQAYPGPGEQFGYESFLKEMEAARKPGDKLMVYYGRSQAWVYAWLDADDVKQWLKLKAKQALGESAKLRAKYSLGEANEEGERSTWDMVCAPRYSESDADSLPPECQEFFKGLTSFNSSQSGPAVVRALEADRKPGDELLEFYSYKLGCWFYAWLDAAEAKQFAKLKAKYALSESRPFKLVSWKERYELAQKLNNARPFTLGRGSQELSKYLEKLLRAKIASRSVAVAADSMDWFERMLSGLAESRKPGDETVITISRDYRNPFYAVWLNQADIKDLERQLAKSSLSDASELIDGLFKPLLESELESDYAALRDMTAAAALSSFSTARISRDFSQFLDGLQRRVKIVSEHSGGQEPGPAEVIHTLKSLRKPGDRLVAFYGGAYPHGWFAYAWLDLVEFKQFNKMRAKQTLGEAQKLIEMATFYDASAAKAQPPLDISWRYFAGSVEYWRTDFINLIHRGESKVFRVEAEVLAVLFTGEEKLFTHIDVYEPSSEDKTSLVIAEENLAKFKRKLGHKLLKRAKAWLAKTSQSMDLQDLCPTSLEKKIELDLTRSELAEFVRLNMSQFRHIFDYSSSGRLEDMFIVKNERHGDAIVSLYHDGGPIRGKQLNVTFLVSPEEKDEFDRAMRSIYRLQAKKSLA